MPDGESYHERESGGQECLDDKCDSPAFLPFHVPVPVPVPEGRMP